MRIRFLSVQKAAALKGCAPMTILRAVQRGELEVSEVDGNRYLLDSAKVEAWTPRKPGRPRKNPAGEPA